MAAFDPSRIPDELLKTLKMGESQRDLLARFLFRLRGRLGAAEEFKEGVAYADRLEARGGLAGLTKHVIDIHAQLAVLATVSQAMTKDRRLSTDDEQALAGYLENVREQWSRLTLPLIRKRTVEVTSAGLKQVFVPLGLHDQRAEQQARQKMERQAHNKAAPERMEAEEARPIGLGDLLARYPRFILTGPPGCGKSTLLARLALAFAEDRAGQDLGWKGARLLPVLLRLRNFGSFLEQRKADFADPSPGALLAYLEQYFRTGQRISLTPDFFDHRLAEGDCLVLMDGLDEVAENRDQVAQQVHAFIEHYGPKGNRFGLASRPRGYESVLWQLRPAALAEAQVNPLDPQGIRQLIENLLTLIEPDARLRQADSQDLSRAILGSADLTQIAGTPLFCSALVQVYKYHGARLPERRVDVLDEIVDLLLGYWKVLNRSLLKAQDLVTEDGAGRKFRGVEEAVEVKKRRLSVLALYMQEKGLVEIDAGQACQALAGYLKERERAPDLDTARVWADSFLCNSHERSGLLVESDPGVYAFAHKNFLEFLAASALVQQSKTLVDTVIRCLDDESWEQTILLAGAHPRLAEDVRVELINAVMDQAEAIAKGQKSWKQRLLVAGRLARDMAGYLPGPEHARVEIALQAAMTDAGLQSLLRASAADALDALGWLPPDLHAFMRVDAESLAQYGLPKPRGVELPFCIGKYPVTNAQYARFLEADDFADPLLWTGFPRFDQNSRLMPENWGDKGWRWLQSALQDDKIDKSPDRQHVLPRYWNDPRFGIACRGAPLVGVSWYEANAYCRWLLRHWDALDEGRANPGWTPREVRLPAEAEWALAAGGAGNDRYPWDPPSRLTTAKAEIIRRSNVWETEIRHTTSVGMYPLGASWPFGLWDLAGNVWEWQANFYAGDHVDLAMRGGSWDFDRRDARCASRIRLASDFYNSVGFRVFSPGLF
jgi:formylglycine-generating enzyme required for sulfatase activity